MKQVISTPNAPAALGAYSQAIQANGFVFTCGQLGIDPATGKLVEGGVEAQTRRALQNIQAILEAAGTAMKNVVKVTVYLANLEEFAAMNRVYVDFFKDKPPARSTVGNVGLALNAVVEIEAIALLEA